MPLTNPEVQHVSRHAHGLHHGHDHADSRGVSPLMRSSPSSVSSSSPGTVLYANEGGTGIGEDYVHLAVCNSCSEVRVFWHGSARDDFLRDLPAIANRWD
jgi:hypothetical protein